MAVDTYKRRAKLLGREMAQRGLDAIVFSHKANVSYLTGFMGDDSWVLATKRARYLITDSRYAEQAQAQCPGSKIIVRKGPMEPAVAHIVNRQKSITKLAVENTTAVHSFNRLSKLIDARVSAAQAPLNSIRTVKDDGEIRSIAKAAKIAAQALESVLTQLQPHMSESQLAGLIDYEIRKRNATTSFETIVCFGANASRPHHQPGRRKLRKNDTILIDFGARWGGYCCDITRCFGWSKVTGTYRAVYEAVRQAQQAAIELVRPGVRIAELDKAARQVIQNHGFAVYGHGTGHGLGLDIHESPSIWAASDKVLSPGMVFTIEPGVYIPGKAGVRIEDDILVTKSGAKILTSQCRQDPWRFVD